MDDSVSCSQRTALKFVTKRLYEPFLHNCLSRALAGLILELENMMVAKARSSTQMDISLIAPELSHAPPSRKALGHAQLGLLFDRYVEHMKKQENK